MQKQFTPNRFTVHGDVAHIFLSNNKGIEVAYAIVDIDDLDRVIGFGRWAPGWNKVTESFYPNAKGGRVYLHRFVTRAPKGMDVDHQNHETTDCRKVNLLVCSHAINMQNRIEKAVKPVSGCRNVYWEPTSKQWRVRFMVNKRSIGAGSFKNLEDAIAEANAKRLHYLPNSKTA